MKKFTLILLGALISTFANAQVWLGGKDSVFISQDGGDNYLPVNVPEWEYNDFYVGSDDTTWILGNEGGAHGSRILKTADDGNSFYDTIAANTSRMDDYNNAKGDFVHFPNTDVFMFKTGAGNGRNFVVYDKENNYWNKTGKMNGAFVSGIEPASETHGYAVTALKIWKTKNSGSNWDKVYDIPSYNDIARFGNGNLIAIGINGLIELSTDKGNTWSEPNGISTNVNLNEIEVSPDGQEAVIVGNNGNAWRTTDNGQSWSSVNINNNQDLYALSYAGNDVVVTGGDDISNVPVFHRSTDSGKTWNEVPSSNLDFSDWSGSTDNLVLRDINFSDMNNGWLLLDVSKYRNNALVMRTNDAGENWQSTTDSTPQGDKFKKTNAIWGIDDSTALFSSQSNIYKTIDSGSTWQEVFNNEDPMSNIDNIYFKDKVNGYFIAGNKYYATSDSGNSWTKVNDAISSASFSGLIDSVVAGTKGQILKTSDDGSSWNFIGSITYKIGDFNEVAVSGNNNAVAVGNKGFILKTSNGGIDWNFIGDNNKLTNDIIDAELYGSDSIYAVGRSGHIYSSFDGGNSWAVDSLGESGNSIKINDMDMPLPGNAIVVGNDGVMYKTADWKSWNSIGNGISANLNVINYQDTTNYCSAPSVSKFQDSASCKNSTDGLAWVEVNDGTPPFTYEWNNNGSASGDTLSGVEPGTYEVTITDGCNVDHKENVTIEAPEDSINITVKTEDAPCNGGSGKAWVDEVQGTNNYNVTWTLQGSITEEGDTLKNQFPGTYPVTVEDAATGCKSTLMATIEEPTKLSIEMGVDSVSEQNASDGKAWATVSGGTPGYTYEWNDDNNTTGDTLSGVSSGKYTVTVTDKNGCTVEGDTTVPGPVTAIKQPFSDQSISVYPVPSDGVINISGAKGKNVEIFDIYGNSFINRKIDNDKEKFNLKSTGIYFIKIEGHEVKKIVVQD